jgi:hypothetical protein
VKSFGVALRTRILFTGYLEAYSNHYTKNKDRWFESSLELKDIEDSFTSPFKIYGKFYLLRVNRWNVSENIQRVRKPWILNNPDTKIITILEIQLNVQPKVFR